MPSVTCMITATAITHAAERSPAEAGAPRAARASSRSTTAVVIANSR